MPPILGSALDGKATIVTGAASGIGRAAAHLFAQAGAKLALLDRDGDRLQEVVAEIGSDVIWAVTDVSDAGSVRDAVAATVERYGRLDCAFNNAGVEPAPGLVAELEEAEWRRVIDINLTGVFLCMKHEIAAMLVGGGGAIVNTSSGLGLVATPNRAAYISAKHGVLGLTKAAALEYARSAVRVNAICPGIVDTPMARRDIGGDPEVEATFHGLHPIGRMGAPEEIGAAALFLLSDAASFITGEALVVDGGYLAQ